MRAEQGEFGLLGVIELCTLPRFNRVTILALRTKFAAVYILQGVAIVAGGGQAFVNFANMAGEAGGLGVATTQWKLGFLVVECCNFLPTINGVAGFAFFAEIAFVRLAVGMAGKAGVRRFAEFFAGDMAFLASNRFMAALQGKFSFGMVEDDGLKLNELMI
jgi:hypothetical protein